MDRSLIHGCSADDVDRSARAARCTDSDGWIAGEAAGPVRRSGVLNINHTDGSAVAGRADSEDSGADGGSALKVECPVGVDCILADAHARSDTYGIKA